MSIKNSLNPISPLVFVFLSFHRCVLNKKSIFVALLVFFKPPSLLFLTRVFAKIINGLTTKHVHFFPHLSLMPTSCLETLFSFGLEDIIFLVLG